MALRDIIASGITALVTIPKLVGVLNAIADQEQADNSAQGILIAALQAQLAAGGGGGSGLAGATISLLPAGAAPTVAINDGTLVIGIPSAPTVPAFATTQAAQTGSDTGTIMSPALVAAEISALASGKTYAAPNDQTGTTYTIQASDREALIRAANASPITYTLPNNMPEGFLCTVRQTGAGVVSFATAAGASLTSFGNYSKTAGQYAIVTLEVLSNTTGSNAIWALDGMGA